MIMDQNYARFTLRVPPRLLAQLGYIAEFEGRTKNKELEQMIKKRVSEFEREHGEIPDGESIHSRGQNS